jgi:hypothetical protein
MESIYTLAAGIKRKFAFYDTTAFFTRRLPTGARTHLEQLYGKRIRIEPVNPRPGQRRSPGVTISPQRPTLALLRALEGQYRATPSRLDPCLEFITDNPKALWEALVDRLWMRWPTSRRRPQIVEGHTAYFARSGANRNLVLYWHDRDGIARSKVTNEPCVRLEIRLRTRALHSQQLDTVDRMLAINITKVIDHNLRLEDDNGNLVPLPDALIPDRFILPAQPMQRDSIADTTGSPTHPTHPRILRPHQPPHQLWRANSDTSTGIVVRRIAPGPAPTGRFVYQGDQTFEQIQESLSMHP